MSLPVLVCYVQFMFIVTKLLFTITENSIVLSGLEQYIFDEV